MPRRKALQLVVKISKYCNLRCSYCYEFPELGNKHVMPLSDIERLVRNVSGFVSDDPDDELKFIWHGGEPLLVKLDTYEEIGRIQQSLLREGKFWNTAQTNLTVLTDRHIAFLQERRFFEEIGVSIDVYGDQRMDLRGRDSRDVVLRNLQRLQDNDLPFGAITVLSRGTREHMRQTFRFFDQLGVTFRILPFHREVLEGQTDAHGLPPSEIVGALCEVFDEWLASPNAVECVPLDFYINYAVAYANGAERIYYDKDAQENVLVINSNGDTWGMAESYAGGYRYGNLFEQDVEEIFASSTRRRAVAEANARLETFCAPCPYFGACPGYAVGDANPMEWAWLKQSGCSVRKVIDHILERFDRHDLGSEIREGAANRLASLTPA